MSGTLAVLRMAMPAPEPVEAHADPDANGSRAPVQRLPAAEWLIARGERSTGAAVDWRQWLLDDAGLGADLLGRFPAGPCVAAAGTGQPPRGTWACAGPVHLVTAIDHLQLAAPAPIPLEAQESAALLASLGVLLAGTGFRLDTLPGDRWLCECPPDLDCVAAEPSTVIGRNLRDWLPTGRDAVRVRRLVTELQMLLHDHPVNAGRAARGAPTINSLWLWGFGAADEPRAQAQGALLTDDDWLAGLWKLHGGEVAPPDRLGEFLRRRATPLRVGLVPRGAGDVAGSWSALDQSILGPARAALIDGTIGHLALRVGGAAFDVPSRARWRIWRRPRPLPDVLR